MFTNPTTATFIESTISLSISSSPQILGAASKLTFSYVPSVTPPSPFEIKLSTTSSVLSTICSGNLVDSCTGTTTDVVLKGKPGASAGTLFQFFLDQAQMVYCPIPVPISIQVTSAGFNVEKGNAVLQVSEKTTLVVSPSQTNFISLTDSNLSLDITLPIILPQNSIIQFKFDSSIGLPTSLPSPCPISIASSCQITSGVVSLTFGSGPVNLGKLTFSLSVKNPRSISKYPVIITGKTSTGCEFITGETSVEVKVVPSLSTFSLSGKLLTGIYQKSTFNFVTGVQILASDNFWITIPSSITVSSSIICVPSCKTVSKSTFSVPATSQGSVSISYLYSPSSSSDTPIIFELRDSENRVVANTSTMIGFGERPFDDKKVDSFVEFQTTGKEQKGEVKTRFKSKSYLDKGTQIQYTLDSGSFKTVQMNLTTSNVPAQSSIDSSKSSVTVKLSEPLPPDTDMNMIFNGVNPSKDRIIADAVKMVVISAVGFLTYEGISVTSPLSFICGPNCANCENFYTCFDCESGFSLSSSTCQTKVITQSNSSVWPPFLLFSLHMLFLCIMVILICVMKRGKNIWNMIAAINSMSVMLSLIILVSFILSRNTGMGSTILVISILLLIFGCVCGYFQGQKASNRIGLWSGIMGMEWLRGKFGRLSNGKGERYWDMWNEDKWSRMRKEENFFGIIRSVVIFFIFVMSVVILSKGGKPSLIIVEIILISLWDLIVRVAAVVEIHSQEAEPDRENKMGDINPSGNIVKNGKASKYMNEDEEESDRIKPQRLLIGAANMNLNDSSMTSLNPLLNLTLDVPESIKSSRRSKELERKNSEDGLIVIEDGADNKGQLIRRRDLFDEEDENGGGHQNNLDQSMINPVYPGGVDLNEKGEKMTNKKKILERNNRMLASSPATNRRGMYNMDEIEETDERYNDQENELNEDYDPETGLVLRNNSAGKKRTTLSDGHLSKTDENFSLRIAEEKEKNEREERIRREKAAQEKKEEWLKKKNKQNAKVLFTREGEPQRDDFGQAGLLYLPPDAPHTLLDPETGDYNTKSYLLHPILNYPNQRVKEVKQKYHPSNFPVNRPNLSIDSYKPSLEVPDKLPPKTIEPLVIQSVNNKIGRGGNLLKAKDSMNKKNFLYGYWSDMGNRNYLELIVEEDPEELEGQETNRMKVTENMIYDNPILEKSSKPIPKQIMKKIRSELSNLINDQKLPLSLVLERAYELGIPGISQWKNILKDSDDLSTDNQLNIKRLNGQIFDDVEKGVVRTKDGKAIDLKNQREDDLKIGLYRDSDGNGYLLGDQDPLSLRKGLVKVSEGLYVPLSSQPSSSLGKGVIVSSLDERKPTHVNGQTIKDHESMVVRDSAGEVMNIRKQLNINISKGKLVTDLNRDVDLKVKQDKIMMQNGLYADVNGTIRRYVDDEWERMGRPVDEQGIGSGLQSQLLNDSLILGLKLPSPQRKLDMHEEDSPINPNSSQINQKTGQNIKKESVGNNRTNQVHGVSKRREDHGKNTRQKSQIQQQSDTLVINLIAEKDESFDLSLNILEVEDDMKEHIEFAPQDDKSVNMKTVSIRESPSSRGGNKKMHRGGGGQIGYWDATDTFIKESDNSNYESGTNIIAHHGKPGKHDSTARFTDINTMNTFGKMAEKNILNDRSRIMVSKNGGKANEHKEGLFTNQNTIKSSMDGREHMGVFNSRQNEDEESGRDDNGGSRKVRQQHSKSKESIRKSRKDRNLHSSVDRMFDSNAEKMDHLKRIYVGSRFELIFRY